MSTDNFPSATPEDFFCPVGGTWYACQTGTKFIGCCTTDPCSAGCFGESLRPAGFSARVYNQSPGGTCGGSTDFWTCLAGPSFWGCCNANPCANNATCPTGKLEPAIMDRPAQIAYFGALNVLVSSVIPSATPSPSVKANGNPSATANDSPSTLSSEISSPSGSLSAVTSPPGSGSSSVSGAVIGGAVGGAVGFVAIIGVVIFFLCYRRRRAQKSNASEVTEHGHIAVHPNKYYNAASPEFGGNSPPPTYSYGRQGITHEPQELPAAAVNRHSELPGQTAAHRFSELPAGALEPRELESPEVSPMPTQTEFAKTTAGEPAQGLGLGGTGGEKR